ncbi:MAG: hypothetical protein V4659_00950 [Pseudomonadota bacterium]
MKILLALAAVPLIAGCGARAGDLTEGGIQVVRSACPTVAIPAATGDITTFSTGSTEAAAIDVTAAMTNVRSVCDETGSEVVTRVTFDVQASRTDAASARDVTLPYFIAIVRGGNAVTAKRLGQVTLRFAAGQRRAQAAAEATTAITRSAATLSEEARKELTRKRKAGDETAAIDPLSQPEIRQAVLRATFEALVGFQLTQDQLRYNATR